MSDDGADLGLSADTGMRAVMGDEEAQEAPRRSPEELLTDMRADQGDSYAGTANRTALAVLDLFESQPETRDWPAESPGKFVWMTEPAMAADAVRDADGVPGEEVSKTWMNEHPEETFPFNLTDYVKDGPDLYQTLKEARPDLVEGTLEELTGFMWGWAVNAARYVSGLPAVPNPAIVTIDT